MDHWIKVSTRMLRDARIIDLDDGAFRLWMATLTEAWHQRPKGVFTSERQWRACVAGVADASHLRRLVDLGLVEATEIGEIAVVAWDRHQINPTGVTRTRRWRDGASDAEVTPKRREEETNKTLKATVRKNLKRPMTVSDIMRGES